MTDEIRNILQSLLGPDAEDLSAGQMALRALLTFVVIASGTSACSARGRRSTSSWRS